MVDAKEYCADEKDEEGLVLPEEASGTSLFCYACGGTCA